MPFLFTDGDLITIFDSSDLLFAIQYSHVLKLKIFPHVDDSGCGSLNNNVYLPPHLQSIRQELRFIRDRVNALLESVDDYSYNSGGYPSLDNSSGNIMISWYQGYGVTFWPSPSLPTLI
jgi:hypothetical protein